MRQRYWFAAAALAACCLIATGGLAAEHAPKTGSAHAKLQNPQGKEVGNVDLEQTPNGLIVHVVLTGLPEGVHALHVHETGKCEAPDFKSAGGHLNPHGHQHGLRNAKGPHAGDLPNIHVPASGRLEIELFARQLKLGEGKSGLFDADGSAFVIHQGADDYVTDPAGDAGPRIACGVVVR